MAIEGDRPKVREKDIDTRIWEFRLTKTEIWAKHLSPVINRLEMLDVTCDNIHDIFHSIIQQVYDMCFDIYIEDLYKKHPDIEKMYIPLFAHTILASALTDGDFWEFITDFLKGIDDKEFVEIFNSQN